MTAFEIIGIILMSVMSITLTGYMLCGLYSVISGLIAERRGKELIDRETYVKAMREMKLAGWEVMYGTENPLEAQIAELKYKFEVMNSNLPFKQRIENIVVVGVTEDPDTELPIYAFDYNVICEPNDMETIPLTEDKDNNIMEAN